jgi:hypothetical protein
MVRLNQTSQVRSYILTDQTVNIMADSPILVAVITNVFGSNDQASVNLIPTNQFVTCAQFPTALNLVTRRYLDNSYSDNITNGTETMEAFVLITNLEDVKSISNKHFFNDNPL